MTNSINSEKHCTINSILVSHTCACVHGIKLRTTFNGELWSIVNDPNVLLANKDYEIKFSNYYFDFILVTQIEHWLNNLNSRPLMCFRSKQIMI